MQEINTKSTKILREICTLLHYSAKVITVSDKRRLLHYQAEIITFSGGQFITLSGDVITLPCSYYIIRQSLH